MSTDSDTSFESKTEHSPVCPVCCGRDASLYQGLFDNRFGHPDQFKLMRCNDCSHLLTRRA